MLNKKFTALGALGAVIAVGIASYTSTDKPSDVAPLSSSSAPQLRVTPQTPKEKTTEIKRKTVEVRDALKSLVEIWGIDLANKEGRYCVGAAIDTRTLVMPKGCLGNGPSIQKMQQNTADSTQIVFPKGDLAFMADGGDSDFQTIFFFKDNHDPEKLGPELYRIGFPTDALGVTVALFSENYFKHSITLPVDDETTGSSFAEFQSFMDNENKTMWQAFSPEMVQKVPDGKLVFNVNNDLLQSSTFMGLVNENGELVTLTGSMVAAMSMEKTDGKFWLGKGVPLTRGKVGVIVDLLKGLFPPKRTTKRTTL